MNRIRITAAIALGAALGAGVGAAQEPIPAEGPPPPGDLLPFPHEMTTDPVPPPPRNRELRRGRHQPPRGRQLESLMQHLRESNPEEYEKLQRLREEDPPAFQRWLAKRRDDLVRRQFLSGMNEMPRFREFMQHLSPEERDQMARRLTEAMGRGKASPVRARHPRIEAMETNLQRQLEEYRRAPGEAKEAHRDEIRITVAELFDLREEQRARHIAEAEERVQKLRQVLAERRARRDEIIERRLMELTEGDPLAW